MIYYKAETGPCPNMTRIEIAGGISIEGDRAISVQIARGTEQKSQILELGSFFGIIHKKV